MNSMKKINLQLWSVRDFLEKDFFGNLEKIKNMGYSGVEFAGYYDIPKEEMKKRLLEIGLNPISSHVGFSNLTDRLDSELSYLNELGAKYIVCPGADIKTIDSALKHAEAFNKIGEKAKSAGLILGYHNHAHELELEDGKYPLEVFFENTDPSLVIMEPDLYWVAYAGLDPIEFLNKHLKRASIIHLKQIKNLTTKENVNAGSGIIDFSKIMEMASHADFVYEQEHYIKTSMEEIEESAEYFK